MGLMTEDVLESLVEQGGSDIHIQAGAPIFFRVSGKLSPQTQYGEIMSAEEVQILIFQMLNNMQRKHLEMEWELECLNIKQETKGKPTLK